jgi:hypothetical protein
MPSRKLGRDLSESSDSSDAENEADADAEAAGMVDSDEQSDSDDDSDKDSEEDDIEEDVAHNDNNEDAKEGDEVTRGQVAGRTGVKYNGLLRMFAKYLKDTYPDTVEGDPPSIIRNRQSREIVKSWLHIYSKFPLPEGEVIQRLKAISTVKNAISAVISLWKLRGVTTPETILKLSKEFRSLLVYF